MSTPRRSRQHTPTSRPAGLADRVRPAVQDASAPELGGPYDPITIFEALHDMNHPVQALRAARNSLAEGGSVVIGDEQVLACAALPDRWPA
jgi:hypothetical protein